MKMRIEIDNRRIGPHGQILDLLDGSLEVFAGRYYWYGAAYGRSTRYKADSAYRIYSSPDLHHWTEHGLLIPKRLHGVHYPPYVKHCPATGLYLLWYYWHSTISNDQYGVAVSKEPHGPFEIINENVEVRFLDAAYFNGWLAQCGDAKLKWAANSLKKA